MVCLSKVRDYSRKRYAQDNGFTLVELLVVVGIIVALAAVVIPSVAQFAHRGDTGAEYQEMDSVQSAMDNLMVDAGVITINASPAISKNNWTTFPSGAGVPPLETYLRDPTTAYYYCWDSNGLITDQQPSANACP